MPNFSRLQSLACLLLWPANAHAVQRDPAVVHANAHREGRIGYSEGWFGKGDTRIHYVEAGRGPLIILYHGFPSFWFCWFDQMELLKSHYRVVAVDALGAGLSAKPLSAAPYRIDRLADQLDALAHHLNGRKRFTLIGHDWGAALSFAYAQAHPDRLNAVIGMSAPPYNLFIDLVRTNPEQQARSQYMQRFRALTLEAITGSGLAQRIWQQSYAGLLASGSLSAEEAALFRGAVASPLAINGGMNWYRANMIDFADLGRSQSWPPSDPEITVPAMLIWGNADKTFVEDFLDRIKGKAPGITIVRVDGVGHWTSMENPDAANRAINDFLRSQAKSPRRDD
jgi:epoxide hydrolase 4